jgi:lipopolysaccharide heptosyltransferase I
MNDKPYKNILIIKPSALGDIVHALPAVIALHQAMPAAKITWLVRNQFAPLLDIIPEINERLLFNRNEMAAWFYKPKAFRCFRTFRRQLRDAHFDLVIDFQGLLRSALFARMTGCKNRVGLAEAREGARFFYTRVVRPPKDSPHILDYYYAVLRDLGINTVADNFKLSAPSSVRQSLAGKLSLWGLKPKQYLVLIPGSAHAGKCWPAERFAAAAEQLHHQYHLEIAAVGSAQEKPIIAQIQRLCSVPVADLSGRTSLVELVALLEQAAAVLSNDTGPGHIAAAVNVPTVLVFGHTNPLRLGPYKKPQCIAAIDIEHRGAAIDSPNPAWRIEQVTVDRVMNKITSQLNAALKIGTPL